MIRRVLADANQIFVATLNKLDRHLEVLDVVCRQVKDGRLDLKTEAFRSRQVPSDSDEAIARASEGIDNSDGSIAGRSRDRFGYICTDFIAERIFYSLKTCTRENAHTAIVPFLRVIP